MGQNDERGVFQTWLAPRKLLFYTLFHGFHIGIFCVGWYEQWANEKLAALNDLKFSVWISRGAGLCLSVDTMLILLPMCRTILRYIRPKVPWLHLDESQWFHRQVAYSMLFYTCVHTCAHYVNFYNVERSQVRKEAAIEIHYAQAGGITGHIMLLCMLLMFTTAHARIRKQSFETFWYTHHLFVPFLLAMYTHATGCFVRDTVEPHSPFAGSPFWTHCIGYEGWRWELVAGALYLVERVYREIRSRRDTEIIGVIRHPFDTMELQFDKPSMKYKPGQWLFLSCPTVSSGQWHPFTITSCPFDPYVSVHIRQVGDFTRSLGDALGTGPAQTEAFLDLNPLGMYDIRPDAGESWPALRIDGPYGAPAEDVFNNEVAVLIGTGIGVTPFASILKHVYNLRAQSDLPKRLRRIEFFWICRDTSSFMWFHNLLVSLETQSLEASDGKGDDFLRIHTYLTKPMDIDTANNIVLNSIGTDKDPLTELRSRTSYGRPDFKKLLKGMSAGIKDERYMPSLGVPTKEGHKKTEIGVYFCGPGGASRDIKRACKIATDKEVEFKFWKEHF
ncbi:hypothetical protein EJ08DRAFT_280041 [Tothia fuscella]|uniref:FAD-binding FR-type domain-containing protein n=1 Tax=Tothia fuscella TaxID=1048955 RepID=A0A9P4NQH1_9PEZI|nr:hypothetical protein EJ08DRAFT_280041 [Tothia fuscella]